MEEEAQKRTKTARRTAKSAFTRAGKALVHAVDSKRPLEEVREALSKYKTTYESLVCKHEEYAELIGDDEQYELEERWVEECQETFLKLDVNARMFISSEEQTVSNGESNVEEATEGEDDLRPESTSTAGIPNMHNPVSSDNGMTSTTSTQPNLISETSDDHANPADNDQSANGRPYHNVTSNAVSQNTSTPSDDNMEQASSGAAQNNRSVFRLQKPKLPEFAGDVRDYAIFRSDFKYAVESQHSKRGAITLLRTCLQGKPLELIRGIGTDYDAAWQYLDSIYGDPRFVSDAMIQDISKFKALQEGEDARFCELVHLVNRCYNTLKEVGLPSDMDNSHMLSIIEQKMCADDRKVWAREIEREKKPATLNALLSWMTVEMKTRMRATAPIRTTSSRRSVTVNYVATGEEKIEKLKHKCWLCKSSTHWPDQCEKLAERSVDERIKLAKNNHVCFSCLKRAGRNHRMDNCTRKQQCAKTENEIRCPHHHHPLLHKSNSLKVGVAMTTQINEVVLPVISANIGSKDGLFKRGNVLLDSGAQISLIRQETANALGLNGKNTSDYHKSRRARRDGENESVQSRSNLHR